MFFWTRAILCIGTVTVLAVQRLPPETRPVAAPVVPSAASLLGSACRAKPDLCAAAVAQGLGTMTPENPIKGVLARPEARPRPARG